MTTLKNFYHQIHSLHFKTPFCGDIVSKELYFWKVRSAIEIFHPIAYWDPGVQFLAKY
jgi:hypothetical protein